MKKPNKQDEFKEKEEFDKFFHRVIQNTYDNAVEQERQKVRDAVGILESTLCDKMFPCSKCKVCVKIEEVFKEWKEDG